MDEEKKIAQQEYSKKYYQKNKEKANNYAKKYRENNKEKIKKYRREYYIRSIIKDINNE